MSVAKELTIREVGLSEVEQLQYIARTTFRQAFEADTRPADMDHYLEKDMSIAQLEKELQKPESLFFFAIYNNQVIGYLKVNWGNGQTELPLENAMEIQRIYVLVDFHGQQVGQKLMRKALQVARDKKVDAIWLGVWEKNLKAIRLYENNGFKAFGIHRFLIGNDLQTDLVMKLDLRAVRIRRLRAEDASAFRQLKLWGLQESPFSFSDSSEDEVNKSDQAFKEEFSMFLGHPERFILGAFDPEDQLKGYVIFKRDQRTNARHKSMIHNMYVHPDLRGRGAGKLLMDVVMNRAKQMKGLEQIHLWVLHADSSASGFYKKLGFESQGPAVKQDLKILGRYVDAEYMVFFFEKN